MKIGIIQTQRLGDLIIVLPIAQWFADHGHQVYWPIRSDHVSFMAEAAADIAFLPVDIAIIDIDPIAYYLSRPLELLDERQCERTFNFYYHLDGDGLLDPKLMGSLKFDEYKYARARVPFVEKWNLKLRRNHAREKALFDSLDIVGDYVVVHNAGSNIGIDIQLPNSWIQRYRIVYISELTQNPFDWIYTIEHAAKLVMLDSSFANLTDQLNIAGEKYLVLRNKIDVTPVYRNGWIFCWPFDPIPDITAQ